MYTDMHIKEIADRLRELIVHVNELTEIVSKHSGVIEMLLADKKSLTRERS